MTESHEPHRPGAGALVAADDSRALDAHGFDAAAFEWVPRPRRRRKDGWSIDKQRTFIEVLADTGIVTEAARAVGMSLASAYRLRREPGGHGFAAAWEAAIHQASQRLVDVAFDRAINGVDEPVFDREGRRIGARMRYNDRLVMFLLRAHRPERYRHASRDTRAPGEPLPAPAMPMPTALDRLAPAQPDAPEALMAPEDFAAEMEIAHDISAALEDTAEPEPAYPPAPWAPPASSLTPELERRLAWARLGKEPPGDGSWPPPPFDDGAFGE